MCVLQDVFEPARAGYEYTGRVQFVHRQRSGVPVLDMSTMSQAAAPAGALYNLQLLLDPYSHPLLVASLTLRCSAVILNGRKTGCQHHYCAALVGGKSDMPCMLLYADPQPELFTVLVTSGGHAYTKRLATNYSDLDMGEELLASPFRAAGLLHQREAATMLAEAAAKPASASRKLAQAGISQSVGATASTDLGCDGCSTTDTRVQVLNKSADVKVVGHLQQQ